MYTIWEGGIQALRQALRHDHLAGDLLELVVRLEGLHIESVIVHAEEYGDAP